MLLIRIYIIARDTLLALLAIDAVVGEYLEQMHIFVHGGDFCSFSLTFLSVCLSVCLSLSLWLSASSLFCSYELILFISLSLFLLTSLSRSVSQSVISI